MALRQNADLHRLPYWLVHTLPAEELRRYNAGQPRDPGGEGGGQWVGAGGAGGADGGLKDTLRIADRIHLEPAEKLLGSAKVDAPAGGARMALTEHDGRRMLRLGLGSEGYGKRNRDEGVAAWDGNPPRPPLSDQKRRQLDAEHDALDEEYNSASPARQEEIDNRLADIREELTADEQGFNGTAQVDEYAMRRLADRIRPAMAEAVEQQQAENKAWDEIGELEANGNPDPDRMAALRRVVDRDYIVFTQGLVPGSAWGDIDFSVELDDPSVGPNLVIGVRPKGVPDDWGDDQDWQGRFDPAETRKLLRLLEKFAESSASRGRNPEGAMVHERYNDQHAPAGSSTGGQFAPSSGGSTAKAKPTTPAKKAASRPARRPRKPDDGTLSYDAGSNQGTGYNSAAGDSRVHALQQALTRLGVKDSAGKPLRDDGKLGPKTTSAVKALQQRLGVKADGKVTPALLAQVKTMKSLPAQKRSGVMDICVRSFAFEASAEPRSNDGRTLEGYAAVFNSPTRIAALGGDFEETIFKGAFKRSLERRTPILQWDHGKDPRIGTAPIGDIEELREDDHGLYVRARLYDHPDIERVRLGIKGRSIRGMSFRFGVPDGGDEWPTRDKRNVRDLDAYELGPVAFPAYDSTTVSVRSLLAQLGPEEHRTLLRELAYDLRSIDLDDTARKPSARSSGSGDTDRDDGNAEQQHLSIRQRLDQGALRARGILT